MLPCQPTHARRAQAVDRKNLVVVLALGVASGCVLGFLAAAVFLQCSWAAAHLAAAAGVATLSPRFSACPPVVCDEPSAALLGACCAGVLACLPARVSHALTQERGAQAAADGHVSALVSEEARGAEAAFWRDRRCSRLGQEVAEWPRADLLSKAAADQYRQCVKCCFVCNVS